MKKIGVVSVHLHCLNLFLRKRACLRITYPMGPGAEPKASAGPLKIFATQGHSSSSFLLKLLCLRIELHFPIKTTHK